MCILFSKELLYLMAMHRCTEARQKQVLRHVWRYLNASVIAARRQWHDAGLFGIGLPF